MNFNYSKDSFSNAATSCDCLIEIQVNSAIALFSQLLYTSVMEKSITRCPLAAILVKGYIPKQNLTR